MKITEFTAPESARRLLPVTTSQTQAVLEPRVVYNFDFAASFIAENIRAIMESQALSMKLHSAWQNETFQRIIVTGGAAGNASFRRQHSLLWEKHSQLEIPENI